MEPRFKAPAVLSPEVQDVIRRGPLHVSCVCDVCIVLLPLLVMAIRVHLGSRMACKKSESRTHPPCTKDA